MTEQELFQMRDASAGCPLYGWSYRLGLYGCGGRYLRPVLPLFVSAKRSAGASL